MSSTWRSASPISTRRATSSRRAASPQRRLDPLRPHAGLPGLARGHRRGGFAHARHPRGAAKRHMVPGGKPIMFYVIMALLEEGDEVIYPNPGFPIYESMINFVGAKAVPIPLREERGFGFDLDLLRAPDQPPHPAGDPQLAAEPHRRRDPAEDIRRDRRPGARARHHGAVRRDLLAASSTRASPLSIASLPGHAGADHHPGRLLQDLRHDRLAHRLRRDAPSGWQRHHPPDDQQQLLHRQLHPARRPGGAHRPAGGDRQDGGRVAPPPRRHFATGSTPSPASAAGSRKARSMPSRTSPERS